MSTIPAQALASILNQLGNLERHGFPGTDQSHNRDRQHTLNIMNYPPSITPKTILRDRTQGNYQIKISLQYPIQNIHIIVLSQNHQSRLFRKKTMTYYRKGHTKSRTMNYRSTIPLPLLPLCDHDKNQSYRAEHNNWHDMNAMVTVLRQDNPGGSNIIESHVVYHHNSDRICEARIVPQGHRDADKDILRTDAPYMNTEMFRIFLYTSAEHNWEAGQRDVTAAFLQAKGFDLAIFFRPPREENSTNI